MASTNSAQATGAGHDEAGQLRKRNVSSYEKANGNTVYSVEAEDTKKLVKKVRAHILPSFPDQSADVHSAAIQKLYPTTG